MNERGSPRPGLTPKPRPCGSAARGSRRELPPVALQFLWVGFNLAHFGGHRTLICLGMRDSIFLERRNSEQVVWG